MTITTPDGRTVRLVPQDGPPAEPGLYLAEYTPAVQLLGRDSPPAVRHTIARDVTRDERGRMCHGPDSARLEWWARIVHEAPVSEGIRALAVDGDADGQRGEGAAAVEPSTQGREVVPRAVVDGALHPLGRCECAGEGLCSWCIMNQWRDRATVAESRVADLTGYCAALAERLVPGHRGLLATAVDAALARLTELEAERRWVPVDDGLPDDGASVLAWDPRKGTRGMFHAGDGAFYPGDGGSVTHWRPLPAGPEVQP